MNTESLDRAIRSVLMPGFTGPDLPDWLADEVHAGLGAVCLFASNIVDAEQVRGLNAAIHEAGPAALVAIDEEGGDVTRLHHATGSPQLGAAALGRLDAPRYTRAVGRSLGRDLASVGVDMNLAPVADVNSNADNPVIGIRSFGADPALVARHVASFVEGLQGVGVAATAKHFPGHGDTSADSHHAQPVVDASRADLFRRELVPFEAALKAGVLAVMTSHLLVPALDPDRVVTLSPAALGVLRNELGFDGVIVSDALDMAGVSTDIGIPEAAVRALAAGVDLLCLGTHSTAEQLAAIRVHIREAVASGRLAVCRLLEASVRVSGLSAAVADLRDDAALADAASLASNRWVIGARAPGIVDSFEVRRTIVPHRAPAFVRLASTPNMAAGDGAWGVAEHMRAELDAALPGALCVTANTASLPEVLAALVDRQVVVLGRDLARVAHLAEAVRVVRASRPDAIVVELGWPGTDDYDVATFGASRASSAALIRLLAEGTR